jgi:predicted glycoside hydrolase/deacetylase ChbG (UPF0249 family)
MPTPDFTRITITGDDFGLSPAVNAEIERYHQAGALHQASLMVAAPHAAEAVAIARRCPALRVGLHLVIAEKNPALAGLRAAFDPIFRRALRAKIERQFTQFRAFDLPPTYWDGHMHLHLHPVVLRHTLPIASAHGFRHIRLVREPGPPALVPWIFSRLSQQAQTALTTAGIGHANQVFGLRSTGRMNLAAFRAALAQAKGDAEIYFHPGAEAEPPDPSALAALLRAAAP